MASVTTPNEERTQIVPEKVGKTITQWLQEENRAFEGARKRITARFTQIIAAYYIANAKFPNFNGLPTLKPFPFTTFGHQPNLDYRKLQHILWDTISSIRSLTKTWASVSPFITAVIIVGALLTWWISVDTFKLNEENALWVALTFLGCTILGKYLYSRHLQNRVAEVRVKTLDLLLHGEWGEASIKHHNKFIDESTKFVGTGGVDGGSIPVVVIRSETNPFPGFGRLQLEDSYICRPTGSAVCKPNNSNQISENILVHVKSQLSASGVENIRYGEIVVIHANSIRAKSPWLDQEKRPLLTVERRDLEKILSRDSVASVREYFMIEVLFEEFMTTAYFFFRPFLAGNAAACHLAVSTLGPPASTVEDLEQALLRYKLKRAKNNAALFAQESNSTMKYDLRNISKIRSITFDSQEFQSSLNYRSIKKNTIDKMYKLNQKQKRAYQNNFDNILQENVFWPGMSITNSPNTREEHSLTFTNDFFGRPESIASVKTLYNQISRAILDALKDSGYDVSDYCDNEGNYTIRADKIDNLVVGENIHIKQSEKTEAHKSVNKQNSDKKIKSEATA